MPNQDRMKALEQLSPVEAIQSWLDGDFGMNEEPALCNAIRKDPRITHSDNRICEALIEAMDNRDAAEVLEQLASTKP